MKGLGSLGTYYVPQVKEYNIKNWKEDKFIVFYGVAFKKGIQYKELKVVVLERRFDSRAYSWIQYKELKVDVRPQAAQALRAGQEYNIKNWKWSRSA